MQFVFMPGKGTTDAIFRVRQMQKKYVYVVSRLVLSRRRLRDAAAETVALTAATVLRYQL